MKIKFRTALFSNAILYLISFIIPVYIMIIILYEGNFYPFGDKTLFIMDMKNQYIGFFSYLKNMTPGDNSLFFCWSRSMGGNFLGLFAYYLASPLSFLVCFFPVEKLHLAILLLTVLKIGLCGVSFAVYCNYMQGENRDRKFNSYLIIWMFSTSYSLISYNMVYSLCLMWLDGVILLPAVLLGVEKLLNGKKGLHYTLSLATLFFCNYYTGYMAGIFTAIYFFYRLVCHKSISSPKSYLKFGKNFVTCTILAIGLSSPLLLPAVQDLTLGKLDGHSVYSLNFTTNFMFSNFIDKFKNGAYDSITNSGLPSIYCGIIVLIFAGIFFICRNILLREKIGAIIILTFFFFSFYFDGLNLAWHGFQSPIWFPYRYAFLYSFFIIFLAIRAVYSLNAEFYLSYFKQISNSCINNKIFSKTPILILIIVLADLTINGQSLISGLDSEFGYAKVKDYQNFIKEVKPFIEWVQQKDNKLYRINNVYDYSMNDAMLLGFNGMTHFSSTSNNVINYLTIKLGIDPSPYRNSGYGSTPLTDSLFSVSYKLSDRHEPDCYEKLLQNEKGVTLYQNNLTLPMVYAANVTVMNPDLWSQDNPFQNQNIFLNAITGKNKNYFQILEHNYYNESKKSWSYSFTAKSSNPIYLFIPTEEEELADVYVNDIWFGNYFSSKTNCLLYIGNYEPGQQVIIQIIPQKGENFSKHALIASLDINALDTTLDELRADSMNITSHKNGTLSGNIFVRKGQTIITSIPYDKGWTVLVDGQKVETMKFAETFLALSLSTGEHELYFSYTSPGFYTGISIFVLSAIISFFYFNNKCRFLLNIFKTNIKKQNEL